MRIFKVKAFARFARKQSIRDAALRQAVGDAEAGLIEADLGGDLIKLRLARRGQGKRGGFRVLLMYRHAERAVFLHGFAKSIQANIDDDELASLQDLARFWRQASDPMLDAFVKEGRATELTDDETEEA